MKKLLSLTFVVISFVLSAQKFEWAISAGSAGTELGSDLATDPVSGTNYIIGSFSNTITLGTYTLTSAGGTDVFFAKLDRNGNYLWAKKLGSTADDVGNAITYDATGNVYITGGIRAATTFTTSPSTIITPMGAEDGFVAQYDANGNFVWVTDINNNTNAGDESGKTVEMSPTSGYVFVGIDETGKNDILIRRYAAFNGVSSGVYSINSTAPSIMDMKVRYNASASPASDEVYLCGIYTGALRFGASSTVIHNSVSGSQDLFVTKIRDWDNSPFRAWSFSGGGTGDDVCNSIDINQAATGGFSFTGEVSPNATIHTTAMNNSTGYDGFVGYYAETLTSAVITKKYIKVSGATGTYGKGVVMDASNNVYITGYGNSGAFENGPASGLDAAGIAIVKFWPNGYVASRLSAAGSYLSFGNRITLDNQGNLYSFGTYELSNDFGVTTLTAAGNTDMHLEKINCTAISSPAVASTKCVSSLDGAAFTVNFRVSKKLNSSNVFTLQIDTTGTGDFVSYFNSGTLVSDTSGSISTSLPGGNYAYADFRIVSSNPAYIGDQSYFTILPKLVAAVSTPVGGLVRCSNSSGSVTAFTASGSNSSGTTYTFNPTTGISGAGPTYTATPNATTTYTMSATNANGCIDTATFKVTVNQAPTLTPVSDPIYTCPGTSVALTNTVTGTVTSYSWSPSSTLSNATAAAPISTPTANTLYSYTITTAENCTLSNTLSVNLYTAPVVNAGPAAYTTCLGSNIILAGSGTANTYTWSPAAGITHADSLSTPAALNATTTYTLTGTENFHGCTAKDVITINIGNVTVDAGSNATVSCGNSTTLAASATGTFVTPYTYSWSPSVGLSSTTTQSTVANPQTTHMYYVTMTTANGCSATDSIKVTSTEPNYSAAFSAASQLITLPSPAQFNNTTPSPSNYTFYWYFGDGITQQSNNPTVFHVYSYNGTYDVTLVAVSNTTGCADTMRIPGYIFATGGTSCSATASVSSPNGLNGCAGDSVKLTANTGAGLTYQWMLNGVNLSGATASTYYAFSAGNYAVAVNNGSCAVISPSKYVSFNAPPTAPTITPNGNLNLCSGGSLYLQANSGYTSYHWSTGASTQNITINQSGVYVVTVTNGSGCKASASYSANTSSMPAPDICIVGMDSLTSKHKLVWNKPISSAIDSFIIYREGVVANQFNRIGAQDYMAFSTFTDNTSAPATQAYRYKLALKDTCGIESLQSTYHKTIHLTINAGVGGAWNLIWNHYEGISFGTYNIYSGTALNNMTLLTSIASTNNSYTDLTPPPGIVYYQIEVLNGSSCNPTAKTMNNFSSSRSNIVNANPTGISGYYELAESIQVMPNPFTDELTINIGKISSKNYTLTLTDMLGKVIIKNVDNDPTQQFKLSDLAAGVYYLTIIDENNNRFTKKVIKN